MYKLCIITPCSRFENLDTMYETVKHPSVLWIIVHDSLNHTLKEYENTVQLICHRPDGIAGKPQINAALDILDKLDYHGYCYVLDDDNIIHPDFYKHIFRYIKKGFNSLIYFNQDVHGVIRIPSLHVGMIDQAQYVFHIPTIRFSNQYDGDGIFVEMLAREHSEYINETLCYYNKLRPL